MGMTVHIDPRSNKGICSSCRKLSVQVTESGGEEVHCTRFLEDSSGPLIRITKRLAACTDFDQTKNINYSVYDAWTIKHEEEGISIEKSGIRFHDGKYQHQVWKKGGYFWTDTTPVQKKDPSGI